MTLTVSPRRRAAVLYAGVAVFVALAAFTARSIQRAWSARSGEARASAMFDLVGQRTPSRPTEAPGAIAWLQRELVRYDAHVGDESRARLYRSLAVPADRVPDALAPVLDAMQHAATATDAGVVPPRLVDARAPGADSLRRQRLLTIDGRTLVVTRPRGVDAEALTAATSRSAQIIARARVDIDRALANASLPAIPSQTAPRPVRIYVVDEDGTLMSSPWPSVGDDERAAVTRELTLLSTRSALPTFAPLEFFFGPPTMYSGFYLDLGGRGLVSTVLVPVDLAPDHRSILALDLAFDVDWEAFARAVDAPVQGGAVHITNAGQATWATLEPRVDRVRTPRLATAVAALATRASESHGASETGPLRLGVVDDVGAVAAFQVSDSTWLLMLFPQNAPTFPVTAVALLAGLLALLFAGFEFNRRRAEGEQARAERALAEKQNLLNTMQVPLVVVDPNTDVIVSANKAAAAIGIRAGSRFADLVADDPRARDHYQRMQAASTEPRRAYGIPMNLHDDAGAVVPRYALVRSVAVTAPIDALQADERHRLGVLFVVEPEADIAILAQDIGNDVRRDERRRLAGLLSHGVDTLARVLEHTLNQAEATSQLREFSAWLSDYLERRLTVAGWLLEHWDDTPPLTRGSVVDAPQIAATIARLTAVFAYVAQERDLRARLHWDNGVLAKASPNGSILDLVMDWPASFECTCPVRGGVGLFLGEVLINAVRHGEPGSVPRVSVAIDRVRQELVFRVENALDSAAPARVPQGEAYGGLSILKALARLFAWRDLSFEFQGTVFVAQWRMPVSDRGIAGQAD